jgi:hypothetical protein
VKAKVADPDLIFGRTKEAFALTSSRLYGIPQPILRRLAVAKIPVGEEQARPAAAVCDIKSGSLEF